MKIDVEGTIKTFRVPSKSEKGVNRRVELTNKGRLFCDCPAGSFNRNCRHKKAVIKHIEKNGYPPEQEKIYLQLLSRVREKADRSEPPRPE